jgi:lipopolysaccharide/colanic/teichoic acid biosynthesis glycosyltransferase
MRLLRWDELPQKMQNEQVRRYYEHLANQRFSLFLKRSFDLFFAIILLIFMLPLFLVITIAITMDSKGSIFFRQTRITQYGREFKIFKFRTMVQDAEKIGAQVTVKSDPRITKVGHFLRIHRLDEYPQLLNIITGDMTFVGTRPEVPKYVAYYTDEMLATLLLPAGVTSEASIYYKDEAQILDGVEDVDKTYIKVVLPEKMAINLSSIENYSVRNDLITLTRTIIIIIQKKAQPKDNQNVC